MITVIVIFILLRISFVIGLWKIFEMAGVPGWKSLVPIYAEHLLITRVIGRQWWWLLYLLVPVVGVFAFYVLIFDLLRCLGRDGIADQAKAVFSGLVYLPVLAFAPGTTYRGKLAELPTKKSVFTEWVDAIAFAVIAATLIRWLIMEAYTIPTPSMENSLLVGDFLFVSKFHYGTRTPRTPLQVPLTHQKIWFTEIPSYVEWIQLPQYRLPGITSVKREDVVVFNVPRIDENNFMNPNRASWIDYPLDLKTNYIKRCVGVAGDRLEIKNRQVMVNGQPLKNPPLMEFSYLVTSKDEINYRNLKKLGLDPEDYQLIGRPEQNKAVYQMYLTNELLEEVKKLPYIERVEEDFRISEGPDFRIWPSSNYSKWNADNYGPIVIPKKGMRVAINDSTLAFYGLAIEKYEHNQNVAIKDGALTIDGLAVNEYTFKQDYFFMMGDNRHNSHDSRYWGFVPEDHIVGKGFFIWLSIDKFGSFFDKIRWRRFFKPIE
jgi:signal peptidase I